MIQCVLAIAVDIFEGVEVIETEWYEREFPFFFVPRSGEHIWLGDHLHLTVDRVEHGFYEDEPPELKITVSIEKERFDRNKEFIEAWGFKKT